MTAFQYLFDGDTPVNKLPAGDLAYDSRDGHDHWHFKDFAAYSLLDSEKAKVLDSGKEAFSALAPSGESDSMDSRGARDRLGRHLRPVPSGQSIDITDLPNGTYFIRVLANPDDVLLEGSMSNNESLRKVRLPGKTGERWVEVPAYGLIDSENGDCGYFC